MAADLPSDPRVSLVLGAGGTRGGAWIRGAFDALHETTGFRPQQASTLIGTSIGAFVTGRIGPNEPLPLEVFEQLHQLASIPDRPSVFDHAATLSRVSAGRLIALGCPPGREDPRHWIEEIVPDCYGTVVSMKCWPPGRRISSLATAEDRAGEIAASGAVPIGAKPVELDGDRHTDGAVHSVTNADLARPDDGDLLIVIAPLVTTEAGSLTSRSGRHQLRVELDPWRRAAKPVLVIAPSSQEYAHRSDRHRHRNAAHALIHSLVANAR